MTTDKNKPDDIDLLLLNEKPPSIKRISPWTILIVAVVLIAAFIGFRGSRNAPLDVYLAVADIPFKDAVLGKCVNETALENGWHDVGQFVSLRCSNPDGPGITKLEGIEHLRELRELSLSFNNISDPQPLAELPRLTTLDLSHNNIKSLPQLRSAPYLSYIVLNHNQISDLGWLALEAFPILQNISLANNSLQSVDELATLTSLTELNLRSNQIASVTGLSTLTALELLDLGENKISDIGPLQTLINLDSLFLSNNLVTTVESLAELRRLGELSLADNPISDVRPLGELTMLQRLNLERTLINSATDLPPLGDLDVLRLADNERLSCADIFKLRDEYGEAVMTDLECEPAVAP